MTISTTIPVIVTPQAAARIAELGFQSQVDRMIEHARQVLPQLERFEVALNERYDMGGDSGVAIEAHGKHPSPVDDGIFGKLADRMVNIFPPEVLEHLSIDYHPGEPHAR